MSPPSATHLLPAPQAVLFDLDGTLVDSLGDLALATDGTLEALGHAPAGGERVRQWVGRGIDALVGEALTWAGIAASSKEARAHAMAVFARHYEAANGSTTEALPGAHGLLAELDARGTPMGLVTNKARRFTLQLLDALDWMQHFGAIVCGDDTARKKPAPDPVLEALTTLEVDPSHAVMIGDSTYDVRAAQAAGVVAIRLSDGYGPDDREVVADWEGATLETIGHWLRATGPR
ncbi:MAG: phosphoglycolate phosphatase [Pseudomonadota bacterium]